jgi:hypothetical protein
LAYLSALTSLISGRFYLSFAHFPEKPEGGEADILEPHTINAYYVAAMLFFVVFGDNLVRWIGGSETSHWFWLFSGKGEALAVFGALKCSLCSRTGQGLGAR